MTLDDALKTILLADEETVEQLPEGVVKDQIHELRSQLEE